MLARSLAPFAFFLSSFYKFSIIGLISGLKLSVLHYVFVYFIGPILFCLILALTL